ncbi:MAG: hypothetical protein WD738_19335 [Pirellulales bacterium]
MYNRFVRHEHADGGSSKILLLCRRSSSSGVSAADSAGHQPGDDPQEAQLREWVNNNVPAARQITVVRCKTTARILERVDALARRGYNIIVVSSLDRLGRGAPVHHLLRLAAATGIQVIVADQTRLSRE